MHFFKKSFEFCSMENKNYDYNGFWRASLDKFEDLSFYKLVLRTIRSVLSEPERMDNINWLIDFAILSKLVTYDDWKMEFG